MKKLVIITDAWAPQVNGVITSIKKMQELLPPLGIEVSIIHPGLFPSFPLPFYSEIPVSLCTKRRLHRALIDEAPDFVHIATEGPLGFAARRACKSANIPFTTAFHTNFPLYFYLRLPLKSILTICYAYLRWFHNSATRAIVSTPTLKKELEGHGFTKVVVAPLGVDTELFKPHVNPHLPKLPRPIYLYVGRVAAEKSVEKFLECDLHGSKVVIGDGPARNALEKKYTKNTWFLGYKTQRELVDWLTTADVFVFPSITETFGLVILEALACGLPAAAYPVMGPQDIIEDGVTGALSNDLREAAHRALNLSREACRNAALRYSWQHCAEEFAKNLAPIRHTPSPDARSSESFEK